MPDLTKKAENLAHEMVRAADMLMGALEHFEAAKAEKEGAGLDWATPEIEAMLAANPHLQHLTSALLNTAHTNASLIYTAMKDGGTIAAFTDDGFQALRAGDQRLSR